MHHNIIYAGATAFLRDDSNAAAVPLDSGHFALESHSAAMAQLIKKFFLQEDTHHAINEN
jgi:hypothetical protein